MAPFACVSRLRLEAQSDAETDDFMRKPVRLRGTAAAVPFEVAAAQTGMLVGPYRLLRAIECPWVDILAHPTGRRILRREPSRARMESVFEAAVRHGVAVEINCQPERLDIDDILARRARDRGVRVVIDTDAHSPAALGNLRWGVTVARRAWLEPTDVLNTPPFDEFRASLRRHRHAGTAR